jgi:hypothetical protein
MQHTFEASQIRCNGIGGAGWPTTKETIDLALQLIMETTERLEGTDAIFNRLVADNPGENYWVGSRFLDPDRVTARLLTGLCDWAWALTGEQAACDQLIRQTLETITPSDAIIITLEAYRECASADHWYLFEKEW